MFVFFAFAPAKIGSEIQLFDALFCGFPDKPQPAAGPGVLSCQDCKADRDDNKSRAGKDKQRDAYQEHGHPEDGYDNSSSVTEQHISDSIRFDSG